MSLLQQIQDRLTKVESKVKLSVLGLAPGNPNYVIGFAPFERALLSAIASECALSLSTDDESNTMISPLLYSWEVLLDGWNAIEDMKSNLCQLEHISADDRARAFSVFTNVLQGPNGIRKYRADQAKAQNPWFLDLLLSTEDVIKFLEDINFIVNDADKECWQILSSMVKTLPEEMAVWTGYRDRAFTMDGFDLWKVCRKFVNRLKKPRSGPELLDFCLQNRGGKFENHILTRFEKAVEGLSCRCSADVESIRINLSGTLCCPWEIQITFPQPQLTSRRGQSSASVICASKFPPLGPLLGLHG